jgi:hypothetical protein
VESGKWKADQNITISYLKILMHKNDLEVRTRDFALRIVDLVERLPKSRSGDAVAREALIKSHRGRCGKNGPRARRLGASIPAVGCKRQAYTAPGLLSPQPVGLKPFVDFCGVARSGETAAGIAQRSRLQKSANPLQRPSWDVISASLRSLSNQGLP